MNDFGVTGHLADLLNPAMRDKVVALRHEAGMGGERYGVVCGIQDPETRERCNKRICPQGWGFAMAAPERYCLHRENYTGETVPVEDITSILKEHGLPWRPLKTKVNMKEATDKTKKRKKKVKKNVEALQVVQHGTGAQYGSGEPQPPSLFRANDPQAWERYRAAHAEWQRSSAVQPAADEGPASGGAR